MIYIKGDFSKSVDYMMSLVSFSKRNAAGTSFIRYTGLKYNLLTDNCMHKSGQVLMQGDFNGDAELYSIIVEGTQKGMVPITSFWNMGRDYIDLIKRRIRL